MRRIVAVLAAGLLLLAGVLVARTLRATSRQVAVEPAVAVTVDAAAAAEGLAGALRFRTVSYQDPAQFDGAQFRGLHAYLEQRFPRVHRALTREVVSDYSLLYTWEGRGSAAPALLLGHLDVVPIETGTEDQWHEPPFGGVIADGYIWGRGAIDDKGSVVAILEAIEVLLGTGFEPPRTVILAFGHDEEVSGRHGAMVMARRLAERDIAPALVLDEGGSILEGLVPGVVAPVASIGLAEKGYVSVELTAQGSGGHSSMPPRRTAIGVLSQAVERLQTHPVPSNLDAAMSQSFAHLGPELPFPMRLVFANLWLFGPVVAHQMSAAPATDAIIRTTTAPTMFQAGVKENQLPQAARAVVNFRILPGETVETVLQHVRDTVSDPEVTVRTLGEGNDPSPVSPSDGAAFNLLARTVRATFSGTLVTPFLVLGGTDARHYTGLTPNVYRFVPMRTRPDDLARFHGTNERLGVEDYAGMIRFYVGLLRGLDDLSAVSAEPVRAGAGAER